MSIRKKSGNHFSPKAKRKRRIWLASAMAVLLVAAVVAIGISTSRGTISPAVPEQAASASQDVSSKQQAESTGQEAAQAEPEGSEDASPSNQASADAAQTQTAALTDEQKTEIQQQMEDSAQDSGASDGVIYEPGVVLVPVEPGQTAADIDAKLAQADGIATKSVDDQDISQGFVRVKTTDNVSVEDAVSQLDKAGLSSQPNFAYSLADDEEGSSASAADAAASADAAAATSSEADTAAKTNDSKLNDDSQAVYSRAGFNDTGVYKAWDIAKSNKKVSVAVLDTGFLTTHEDLKDNIVATYDATVANPANGISGDVSDVTDLMGHGTHVAGIVSAKADNGKGVAGVSYNAGIVGVKIFPSYDVRNAATETNKKLPHCYTDDIVYAYKYVLANQSRYNIKVINMSIYGVGLNDETASESSEDKLFASQIQKAYDAGIVSVCCAGNNNPRMDEDASSTQQFLPYDDGWPSDMSVPLVAVMNVCASGADYAKAGQRCYWYLLGSSNFNTAKQTEGKTNKNICAPGTWIYSSINTGNDQYKQMSGTSMASPWVAGVLALEFASNPNLTSAQAIKYLYDSATDMTRYGTGWDRYTGYGLVDAYRAVLLASGSNTKRDISDATIETLPIQLLTNGKACEPTPTVKFGPQELVQGKDFTVSYADNTKVGDGTLTITGIGSYTGTLSKTFTIISTDPKTADASKITVYAEWNRGGGWSIDHPVGTVAYFDAGNYSYVSLTENVDYDSTISDVDSNGYVNVTFRGKGIFSGQTFTRNKKVSKIGIIDEINDYDWTIGDQPYTGKPVTPIPQIYYGGYRLCQGVDYTLSYENNVNIGTAKVTVTGKGAYSGTKTVEFKIVGPTNLNSVKTIEAKISKNVYTYTGSPIEPTVTVVNSKSGEEPQSLQCQMEGVENPDYSVSFESNVDAGTAYIVVTGMNAYTGTIRVPFKIVQADISEATVDAIPGQIATGSALTPSVTVRLGGRTLTAGTDYAVSYSDNIQPGTATVTVTGKGNYTGTAKATFAVEPKPAAGTVPMYRLYNRWSGEHLFTADSSEYSYLASIGWNQEGVAWIAPEKSGSPVYRLYNPYSGDHFYTGDKDEYDHLGSIGWNKEGVSFYSADPSTGRPIYRLFNRWLTQGTHLFTTDKNEYDHLGSIGWSQEGIAFYGLK